MKPIFIHMVMRGLRLLHRDSSPLILGYPSVNTKNRQTGSVLIWILVAVVLLAGLTTALNQGSRTSSGIASDQQARIVASEILSYSNSIKQRVQALLMRGCSENEISFENNHPETINYQNLKAPDDERCHVFSAQGGGLVFQTIQEGAYLPNWYSNQAIFWAAASIKGAETDKPDLVIIYNSLQKNVCLAINKILDIPDENGEPPLENYVSVSGHQTYRGTFSTSIPDDPAGDHSYFFNRQSFCLKHPNGSYQFFHTLIAR